MPATFDPLLGQLRTSDKTQFPSQIHVAPPTGTNDEVLINAAIATALNTANPSTIFLSPGVYVCSAPLTSLDSSVMVTIRGHGGKGVPANIGGSVAAPRTEIRYTGTGSSSFISARDATSFTLESLGVLHTSSSYTGILVNIGGNTGPTYTPVIRNCTIGTRTTTIKTCTAIRLGKVVECVIENTNIVGTAVGIDGSDAAYSNVVTIIGGRFEECTIGIKNPLYQWSLTNTVFEPCPTAAISGTAYGLTLVGCGFWDSTANATWINLSAGGGLGIFGGYWEPQSTEKLINITAATFDGIAVVGMRCQAMNGGTSTTQVVLATGGSSVLTNVHIAGNSHTSTVTTGLAAITPSPISSPKRGASESVDRGNSGATMLLTNQLVQKITLTANCVLTMPTVTATSEHTVRLYIQQDATGSRIPTWPSNVFWQGNTVPTLTTTANATDIIELMTIDGGGGWLGRVIASNYVYTPVINTLPTPFAVYDASLLSLSNNDPVASWTDTSGNGRTATQATGGNQPTFITSAINGNPAVRFAGVTQYLYTPTTYALSTLFSSGTFTMIAVATPTNASGVVSITGIDPNSGTARAFEFRIDYNAGSPLVRGVGFTSGGGGNATDTKSLTLSAAHVFSFVRAATTLETFVDGATDGSTAIASANATGSSAIAIGSSGTQIGASNAIAAGMLGDIAYIAYYPGVLTTTQRQSEEARLKTKYATP